MRQKIALITFLAILYISQVNALDEGIRTFKMALNAHEKVGEKLKKRFENAEKLEDQYHQPQGQCGGRCFSYLLFSGSLIFVGTVIFMVSRNLHLKSERDSYTNPKEDTDFSSWYEYEYQYQYPSSHSYTSMDNSSSMQERSDVDRKPAFRLNVSLQDVKSSNISLRSDLEAGIIENYDAILYHAQDRNFNTRSIYEEEFPSYQHDCESKQTCNLGYDDTLTEESNMFGVQRVNSTELNKIIPNEKGRLIKTQTLIMPSTAHSDKKSRVSSEESNSIKNKVRHIRNISRIISEKQNL